MALRKRQQEVAQRRRQQAAAVLLQAHSRAMVSRAAVEDLREQANLNYDAATFLQAMARGKFGRKATQRPKAKRQPSPRR